MALAAAQAMAASKAPQPQGQPCCAAVAMLGISLSLLAAHGFLLAALWAWLFPNLGPALTPLALAVVLLVEAAGFLLLLRRHASTAPPATLLSLSTAQLAPVLAEAQHLFNDHKLTSLLAAMLAGVAAGARRH